MFLPHSNDNGALKPWEYYPAAADTYKVGQMLNIKDGQLVAVKAASTTTPTFVCMASATVAAGERIPVIRTSGDVVYETQLSTAVENATIGTKLQVSAGGLEVDAGAAGTFEVNYIEDTVAGSTVRGRFK